MLSFLYVTCTQSQYLLLSSCSHIPSFCKHFSYSLYLTSQGTCPISFVLWSSLEKGHTVFLSLAQQIVWLLLELLQETERPNRDRFCLMSPAGLCKRTVSTWPKRWHFVNVKIRLQGNIDKRWPLTKRSVSRMILKTWVNKPICYL